MNQQCNSCLYLKNPDGNILVSDYWVVALAPNQGYLGRCYVTLKQHKGDLSSLSDKEWLDFADTSRRMEKALKSAFNATPFNWSCLMNNAYQHEPPQPHVHWHLLPRYEKSVKLNGLEFTDPQFGHHYDRDQRRSVDDATYRVIAQKVKTKLTQSTK